MVGSEFFFQGILFSIVVRYSILGTHTGKQCMTKPWLNPHKAPLMSVAPLLLCNTHKTFWWLFWLSDSTKVYYVRSACEDIWIRLRNTGSSVHPDRCIVNCCGIWQAVMLDVMKHEQQICSWCLSTYLSCNHWTFLLVYFWIQKNTQSAFLFTVTDTLFCSLWYVYLCTTQKYTRNHINRFYPNCFIYTCITYTKKLEAFFLAHILHHISSPSFSVVMVVDKKLYVVYAQKRMNWKGRTSLSIHNFSKCR